MSETKNDSQLERLVRQATAEAAAKTSRENAEVSYRREWWRTTIMLGAEIPHGDLHTIFVAVARVLGCNPSTLQNRRAVAMKISPEIVEDESIFAAPPTMTAALLKVPGVEKIGAFEVGVLHWIEDEMHWAVRELPQHETEIRQQLGHTIQAPSLLVPPRPAREWPTSTVRLTTAQQSTMIERLRGRSLDIYLARHREPRGAVDIGLYDRTTRVARFLLAPDGAVIKVAE